MKTTAIRRILSVILCLTLLMGAVAMTACSRKGTTLLELNGYTISVNQYQLLLSRVKASLYYAGYSVDSPTFWDMVIDSKGNTYDQYFRNAALNDAKRYLAAAALFEEEGLTIVDFKTDRLQAGEEEVKAKEHRLQLELYATAAREVFGLPVKERWVWFLRTGKGARV